VLSAGLDLVGLSDWPDPAAAIRAAAWLEKQDRVRSGARFANRATSITFALQAATPRHSVILLELVGGPKPRSLLEAIDHEYLFALFERVRRR